MFGIDDPAIYLGYLMAILSLIACIVYGVINWNKGMEDDLTEIEKDLKWENKEEKLKNEN